MLQALSVCLCVCVLGEVAGAGGIQLLGVTQRLVMDRGEEGRRQEKQRVLSLKFTELTELLNRKRHTCTRRENK